MPRCFRATRIFVIFLQFLSSNHLFSSKGKIAGVRLQEERRKEADREDVQLIKKCCPFHQYLNEWYNCIDSDDSILTRFEEELSDIGLKNKSEYRIVHARNWKFCFEDQTIEYHVISIAEDSAYVISYFDKISENEEEEDFQHIALKKYECIDVNDNHSLVAVVCENMKVIDNTKSEIQKCCPGGESLSSDYSKCLPSRQGWIPPRNILIPGTETSPSTYTVMTGGCATEEVIVTENAESVFTDRTFLPLHEEEREPYSCVDVVNTGQLVAMICLERGCTNDWCVAKCCPEGSLFDPSVPSYCTPLQSSNQSWTILHNHQDHTKVEYTHSFINNYRKFKKRIPDCEEVVILDKSYNDTFFLLQNGSLHHQYYGVTDKFCLDNTLDPSGDVVEIALKCLGRHEIEKEIELRPTDKGALSCLDQYTSLLLQLHTTSGCISIVFLAITFLVYIFVPELDNLHGKIVLSNVFAIFFLTAYLLLVFNFSHLLPSLGCKMTGYAGYFFTMSMFSWMTIMSFDLCWTFIRAQVPRRGSAMIKFVIYSAVAWGSSAVLTIGIIATDEIMEDNEDDQEEFLIKPNVGKPKCFLRDDALGVFLHFPVMILMIINVILFLITTTTLYRLVFDKNLSSSESIHSHHLFPSGLN